MIKSMGNLLAGRAVIILGLAFYVALAGCSTMTRPLDVYQVELHRSDLQTLQLTNNHGTPIVVLSSDGQRHLTVEPDQTLDITFAVVTLADIHLSATDPWYVIQDTVVHYIDESAGPSVLKTTGTDVVLNITHGDNMPSPLRLSLQNCPFNGWEDGPAAAAVHELISKPPAGIPARLCPQ